MADSLPPATPHPASSRVALAGIFEEEGPRDRPGRGSDLEAVVAVPRDRLGAGPFLADLPDVLETPNGPVRRTRQKNDPAGRIQLNLPADLPDEVRLKLRGQGGLGRSGNGDLLLTIVVQDTALVPAPTGAANPLRMATLGLWVGAFVLLAWAVAWLAAL